MEDDLDLNLSSYSDKELQQLKEMTEQVRDHWKTMLVEHKEKLNPTVEKAIQMSIDQAVEDLLEIEKEQSARVPISARAKR